MLQWVVILSIVHVLNFRTIMYNPVISFSIDQLFYYLDSFCKYITLPNEMLF